MVTKLSAAPEAVRPKPATIAVIASDRLGKECEWARWFAYAPGLPQRGAGESSRVAWFLALEQLLNYSENALPPGRLISHIHIFF